VDAETTETRRPLSRERILRAALALADEGGIEAVTMRRLGQALGFEAMSLYNHVANKTEVLDGVLELVLAETRPPSDEGEWDTAIRDSAISVYEALRRHPWASALLMSPEHVLETRLRHMDALLRRLRTAGFPPTTIYAAYHALDAHIFGFSLWAAGHTFRAEDLPGLAADFMRRFRFDDYPDLKEHAEQHMSEGPHREVSAFEYSLDAILDALRRVHDGEAPAG
jgi:AcrR family transcriptional regulator